MVHKGRYTKGGKKSPYIRQDNRRMKTLRILKSEGNKNQSQLMTTQGLTSTQWRNFGNILDEMVEWGWVEKKQSTDAKNVKMFSLTDTGHNIHKVFDDLLKNDELYDELTKLDIFFERKETSQDETDQASSD